MLYFFKPFIYQLKLTPSYLIAKYVGLPAIYPHKFVEIRTPLLLETG